MRSPDAVIVGAGPSGILVWEQLTAAGLHAVLLEAGPAGSSGEAAPVSDPSLWAYQTKRGAQLNWSRVHAVGGRTAAWGGYCFRFPQAVFERGGWPYGLRALAPYYAQAEDWVGVVQGRVDPHHRNMARRLGQPLLPVRSAQFEGRLWTARDAVGARAARVNNVAIALDHQLGRARALHVVGPTGRQHRICARSFVLAAGPVESTRLLLASEVGRFMPKLGRGLVQHATVSYMLAEPHPAPVAATSYAQIPGAVVPFPGQGYSIEIVGPQPWTDGRLGVEKFDHAFSKAAHSRITFIYGMCETTPNEGGRITLSQRQTDALGRPIPVIHLRTTAGDRRRIARMKASCIALAEALARAGAELFLLHDAAPSRELFHEAGTCVMGSSMNDPCDPRGRVRAIDNVWIADASVFPSAGDRHPTLTILAHALRVARDVQLRLMGGVPQGG
jgi:choline dehydrogenase-like flavoprotein